jgi:hypothetical protein
MQILCLLLEPASDSIAQCIAGINFGIQLAPEFCQILLQSLMFAYITLVVKYLYSKQKRTPRLTFTMRVFSKDAINITTSIR